MAASMDTFGSLQPTARLPVLSAAGVAAILLAATIGRYGYHRDELYFRMLPPAWGYVDQPPLIVLVAEGSIALFGDTVAAIRIFPLLCAVASVVLTALITREVGGGRAAQAMAAWGMAGAVMLLSFGHLLLTAAVDLVVWPAAVLFGIRSLLRSDGRWWLAAGVVIGLGSFNKLLVAVLLVALAVGLLIMGPRRWLRSGWLWAGVGVCGLIASPNLAYQATSGWPQFAMGQALGDSNADEVRVMMWPFLILMVGPVLAIFWVVALIGLFRRPEWRALRLLAIAFAVVVIFVFVAGTQFYYTFGMLQVLVAIGAVPVEDWMARRALRRTVVVIGLVINGLTGVLTALPTLPLVTFGASGLAAVNAASAESVGWETYVEQIDAAARDHRVEAIVTSNYGEAGALDRFSTTDIEVFSGHNALWYEGRPAEGTDRVLLVGDVVEGRGASAFSSCQIVAELDNGADVENEEQGAPLAVCTGPSGPWSDLWGQFRHLS